MKAITVQQPWAWAIIHGGKNIENRTRAGVWSPAIGQRIAIHAGKRWSDRGAFDDRVIAAFSRAHGLTDSLVPRERDREFETGVIIGTAYLADVHISEQCCDPWGEENYVEHRGMSRDDVVHLELDHAREIDPIRCRGALGLWTVPKGIELELLEAVRR